MKNKGFRQMLAAAVTVALFGAATAHAAEQKKPKFNEFALGLAMLAAIFIAQAVRVM